MTTKSTATVTTIHMTCGLVEWGTPISKEEATARQKAYEIELVEAAEAEYPDADVTLKVDRRSDAGLRVTISVDDYDADDADKQEGVAADFCIEAGQRVWMSICERQF